MQHVAIARVRSAFGLAGELSLSSFSGEWDHFLSVEEVLLVRAATQRRYSVEYWKRHGEALLLKLQGVDNREDAKRYAQWNICVERKYAAPAKKDEYYIFELSGMKLYAKRRCVGEVLSVYDAAHTAYLEVLVEEGRKKVLVPFLKRFVLRVDRARKRIYLKESWILD